MFCYSRYDYKKYLCKYLSSLIFNLIDILFRFDDERRDTFEILVKDKPLYVVSIRNFYRICFKLFFYYYLELFARNRYIFFNKIFPSNERGARAFICIFISFFQSVQFLQIFGEQQSSGSAFPPFFSPRFLIDNFLINSLARAKNSLEFDSTVSKDSITLFLFRNSINKGN